MIRIWILLLGLSSLIACEQKEPPSPNFLILMADDLGWQDVGCYGNPYIKTPNIDFIAQNGIQFNNAFLTTAQCSPSRISILTGKYPHSTGAEDLHIPMPDSLNILPNYLKNQNYFNGLLRKSHLGEYATDQFDFVNRDLDAFETFLKASNDQPFFCWVGFIDPHRPYKPNIIAAPQSSEQVIVPPYLVDDDSTRLDLANYYNEIRRMDAKIGDYLQILRERQQLDNTIVIFLSDNGAPFPRAKGTAYDAGIKTPLVAMGKGIPKGKVQEQLMSVIDLAPTILDWGGMAKPTNMQGNSILSLFKGKDTRTRTTIFAERNWHNTDEHIRCVRTPNYKLIENAYLELPSGVAADIGKSYAWRSLLRQKEKGGLTHTQAQLFNQPRPRYEFYDLKNDPYEVFNLADAPNWGSYRIHVKTIFQNLNFVIKKWI